MTPPRTDLAVEIATLYQGQAVTFDIERTSRGLRAVNIALAAEPATGGEPTLAWTRALRSH